MSINAKGQRKQRGAEDLTAEGAEDAEKGRKGEGENGSASTPSPSTSSGNGSATEALVDGQWKVGSWNGMEMHTCVHCQWDTLEGIWEARAHKAACVKCAPPPAPERVTSATVLVADRWGNPIAPPVGEE